MLKHLAVLAAVGTMHVPSAAQHMTVTANGHPLVAMSDPAVDTCSRQTAFVRSRKDQRIVAEYVGCWHELDNFTHQRLMVSWYQPGRGLGQKAR